MRLTDLPRTLADVRPEVAWPAALQRTLDLALARDAADRYQSAAQFGREFAAACAELPDTAGTDAGTVVLGAADLPATRVARPGGATAAAAGMRGGTRVATPAQAPAATPNTRSRGPLIGGGIGAVVVIAGLFWKLGAGGGAPAAAPTDSTAAPTTTVVPTVETRTTPPTGDVQLYARSGTEVPSADAVAPRTAPAATNPRTTPGARPATPTTGGGTASSTPSTSPSTTPPTAPPTAEPAAPDASAQLSTLLREAQGGAGARVLRELAAMQPRLSGQALAESYYVQMIAYTSLEDQDGVCAAAKQVIARHETAARVQLARRASDLLQCGGEATR